MSDLQIIIGFAALVLLQFALPIVRDSIKGRNGKGDKSSGDHSPEFWELKITGIVTAANQPALKVLEKQTDILGEMHATLKEILKMRQAI